MTGDFHFLRPLWLLALPVLALAAAWLWRRRARSSAWLAVVEPGLRPYVLTEHGAFDRSGQWGMLCALAAGLLGVLAAAGPTWDRAPVPAMRSGEALVVALDLSTSMDAADVAPSRLARAKLKLLELLERRESGQTALVVFSAHAFTVAPLTTDTRTIAALVGTLATDLMPSRGSYVEAGLHKAAQLLKQTGVPGGEILVITDADVSQQAQSLAMEIRSDGITVHVLAIGTEDGAPIRDAAGGFVTNRNGEVVVPRLSPEPLRRLASAGGGRFARATPDDSDLDALLRTTPLPSAAALDRGEALRTDVWNDRGPGLALVLLPLLALCFRRGWVAAVAAVWLLPPVGAEASLWSDLWLRRDQQGAAAFAAGDATTAASLFVDERWQAAAQYRAGEFERSAGTWTADASADGHYNRGNALARAGRFDDAIAAYEDALRLDPGHADARHNLEIVQAAKAAEAEASSSEDSRDGSEPPEQSSAQRSTAGGDSASDGQAGEGAAPESAGEPSTEQADAEAGARAESSAGSGTQGEAAEDDLRPQGDPAAVDAWASEQAAEQWLRRIPQDPGGLLRRKFLYQYQRFGVDQEGNYVWPGDESAPW